MTAATAPLITIVIPAYNAEKTLLETLGSVSSQSYDKLEILVVDDGSRDGTFDLARDYGLKDDRVRVLRQDNGGVARARNHGIREARGLYIAPVDADDIWHPEKIELQLQALKKFPDGHGVAYNWYAAIDENGIIFGHSRPVLHQGDIFELLLRENFIGNGSTPLMPRADVLACGGYDAGLRDAGAEGCEDLKLYLALAEKLPFALVPDFLTGYRFTRGNMSSNAHRMLKSHALVMAPIAARYPQLARDIRAAQFNTARWYFKKAFFDGDYPQVKKLAPMMAGKYTPQLIIYGMRDSWRQAKRQGIAMAKRALGRPPARPKTRFAGAVLPQPGTAFSDRFTTVPVKDAVKPTGGSRP
ncbi:glycosyltransferase family 2 protein [Rhizobium hidalgonense]|uniref:Glycosyltransferase family 2 protein n=1 Tax=Rhizobium hidalgonense TaxID=1538159 RepID=A0A2A6KES5_9HYPH|nr:glycosyltransferase family 2 protein [Rhizobium hidalgonense]EJC77402.1 glycosyl transferase [Rhizobium leguminosarum bv. trifolii WSM2012]MDR9773510.1 glycosyltransferase family 2 protein [Rhizobium hidalgonense]MDR9811186.1 glycosyltransferase family 2 protein [Rhizobium hidalgonense]MDR9819470.1 glycosyltransferase family 2 protein [Rhizobium hidalgonense]PDT23416.1 glycosyltransferase family 2 protein [Rhizobium hidalgonense]